MLLFDGTQLALERAIEGAALRQSVLASNLANANTPGYVRKDVDFHGALSAAMTGGSATDVHDAGFAVQDDATAVRRADGGSVDIDQEQAALAANGLDHAAAITVARARLDILGAAMGTK